VPGTPFFPQELEVVCIRETGLRAAFNGKQASGATEGERFPAL
jgi:hypothetical protein